MPPKRHYRDNAESEVLAYIMAQTGEDLGQAIKTFRYLRNKRHLVFDRVYRWWRGAEYCPPETDEEFRRRTISEINRLTGELREVRNQVEAEKQRANEFVNMLNRVTAGLRELRETRAECTG